MTKKASTFFQITLSAKQWHDFRIVFTPLIEGLLLEMRAGAIIDSSYKPALLALAELADIRESGTTNNRPICKLLTEMVKVSLYKCWNVFRMLVMCKPNHLTVKNSRQVSQ